MAPEDDFHRIWQCPANLEIDDECVSGAQGLVKLATEGRRKNEAFRMRGLITRSWMPIQPPKRGAYLFAVGQSREEQDGCCRIGSRTSGAAGEEEVAMLRQRWIVGRRRWWNISSLWEQIRRGLSSMLCAKFSSRSSRPQPLWRRCHEKEEEAGMVRTNMSRAKPVSSWRCQRQASSVKTFQRVVCGSCSGCTW